jgi:hypothetical protein
VEKIENSDIDPCNVSEKASITPQQLGWVGCNAQKSSTLGVGNWGEPGVEIPEIGVGDVAEKVNTPSPAAEKLTQPKPATIEQLKTGAKVLLHMVGSKRDRCKGVVSQLEQDDDGTLIAHLLFPDLPCNLQSLEISLPGNEGWWLELI